MDCDATHFTTSSIIFSCLNLLLTLRNKGTQQVIDDFPISCPD